MELRSQPILTTRQLATTIGASDSSVKRWIDRGEISAFRTAGGHRRIPIREAIRFIRRTGASVTEPHGLGLPHLPLTGAPDAQAAELLVESLRRDDPDQADAVIVGRFLSGADIAQIGDQMIQPALASIGELRRHEADGVLYKHRAVDICVRIVERLAEWLPVLPSQPVPMITAAGPGDSYRLPPLLASLTLRECGAHARNLGPQTPIESIALAVERYRPSVCALSFSVRPADDAEWQPLLDRLNAAGTVLVLGEREAAMQPRRLARVARVCSALSELSTLAADLIELDASRSSRSESYMRTTHD